MATLLNELIVEGGSWQSMCEELGAFLNLDQPVSSAVLNRALNDDKFAHYLIVARENQTLLKVLLDDPKNSDYEPDLSEKKFSNTQLAKKALGSLAKWGKQGFKRIDKETFERRWSACTICPYLDDPPEQLMYRLARIKKGPENKICTACGCVALRKAKIPHEFCPQQDPADPLKNRWGQEWNRKK